MPFQDHVRQRTIVLPELRTLFLPIPKAGCTTVLWTLAELAGIPEAAFLASNQPEVSPALTVHDMSVWGPVHRLADYEGRERERVLSEDGWFRFALVRDPATRLFSAWQSKLLLREPRFAAAFGDAPWFPRVPERARDVLDDYRTFLCAVARDGPHDVHWAVQDDLVDQLRLTHVGRVERMDTTLALLRAHVGDDVPWPAGARRENRSALPLPPGSYAGAASGALAHYARDHAAFGYAPPVPEGDLEAWAAAVEERLGGVREAIDRHERIRHLHDVAQRRAERVQMVERRLEEVSTRQVGRSRSAVMTNLEGHEAFDVRWGWSDGSLEPGFTAVVRVRDEERSLPWVLPPLLRAVEHVLLIDNGSRDATVEVALAVAAREAASDRLEVRSYPFEVAPCGDDHLTVAPRSVHSLTHFYNWSFSHVRTGYVLKWDGDMVLTDAAADVLRDLAWQLEAAEAIVRVPRHPLYVVDDRLAFVDVALRNCEPWGWPNRPGYSFAKAFEWELPLWPRHVDPVTLPDGSCVELKHLDADEFGHWSTTDFDASPRTRRKQRELAVFRALAAGEPIPDGVVEVRAPAGTHVVDHVRSSWLPERNRG